MDMSSTLIYEYPTNDCVRVCLRLEPLLQYAQKYDTTCSTQHRQQLLTYTDILNILDRPDLKTKFITLITQKQQDLIALKHNQYVDQTTLDCYLTKLKTLNEQLNQHEGICSLKLHPLLTLIRQQHSHPGGLSDFTTPQLRFWLHQSTQQRIAELKNLHHQLQFTSTLVTTLLPFIRQARPFQTAVATQGFFQTILNANQNIHLIRIRTHLEAYPEISVGKHRLSIHFLTPGTHTAPPQTLDKNVKFEWAATH
jgi:cell division protein ZapD